MRRALQFSTTFLVIALQICAACGQDRDEPGQPANETGVDHFRGFYSAWLASRQVKPGGRVIGGAGFTNGLTLIRSDNFLPADELRGMILTGINLGSGTVSDTTFGIEYGGYTKRLGDVIGGYSRAEFGDRLTAGYQHWELPGRRTTSAKDFVYGRWDHFSRAHWALTGMYGFADSWEAAAGLIDFRMLRSWSIRRLGVGTMLTPSAGVAYGVNWFEGTKDGTAMILGLSLDRPVTERLHLGVNAEGQQCLSGHADSLADGVRVEMVAHVRF